MEDLLSKIIFYNNKKKKNLVMSFQMQLVRSKQRRSPFNVLLLGGKNFFKGDSFKQKDLPGVAPSWPSSKWPRTPRPCRRNVPGACSYGSSRIHLGNYIKVCILYIVVGRGKEVSCTKSKIWSGVASILPAQQQHNKYTSQFIF